VSKIIFCPHSGHKNIILVRLISEIVFHTYILTYLRSWALLEKLPILQPLKNFPKFYGTRRFNTVFTRALHWSLSLVRSIQSIPSHPISLKIYFNTVNPAMSWPSWWSLSDWLPHLYPICIQLFPHSYYMPCPSHPPSLDHSNYVWRGV
jgi:hypothetical protein